MNRHKTFAKFVDDRVIEIINEMSDNPIYRAMSDVIIEIEKTLSLKTLDQLNNANSTIELMLFNEIYAKAFRDGFEMKTLMVA
ncbi:MAG: hypothetical protein WCP79_14540 [Bacillota bacterium]